MSDSSARSPNPPVVPQRRCVLVCQHRSCQRNGSDAVLAALKDTPVPNVFVGGSDCTGQCSSGPTVRVMPDGIWYCRVKPEDVSTIVEQHLWGDRPVEPLLNPRLHPRFDAFFHDEDSGQGQAKF